MKALLVIFLLATAGLAASGHQHRHHKSQHCKSRHHKSQHHKSQDHKSHHHTDCGVRCGPNRWQAAPCLESAERKGCDVIVKGSLESVPDTEFLIQFFDNPLHRDEKAEGKTLVGQKIVKTDSEGNACIEAVVTCTCACGDNKKCKNTRSCDKCRCPNHCTLITATATRLREDTPGDTSEFSKSVKVS